MKKLIIIALITFCIPALTWAGCSISTPAYSVTKSGIVPNPYYYNLDPYTITFQCDAGTAYTISYVSPTQNTGGMIQQKYVEFPTKYFQLYLYRDSGRTDAIRPSYPNIKVGTATGSPETAVFYPQTRVGGSVSSGCTLATPYYYCPAGTLSVNITLKIVF